jgi:hypothetical protein
MKGGNHWEENGVCFLETYVEGINVNPITHEPFNFHLSMMSEPIMMPTSIASQTNKFELYVPTII